MNIELRKIDIDSPIPELKIGIEHPYYGEYVNGYEEGISNIKRIYKEVVFWNNVESKPTKDGTTEASIWVELENGKLILLGYFCFEDKFRTSNEYINYKKQKL